MWDRLRRSGDYDGGDDDGQLVLLQCDHNDDGDYDDAGGDIANIVIW